MAEDDASSPDSAEEMAPLIGVGEFLAMALDCWRPLDEACHADILLELAIR